MNNSDQPIQKIGLREAGEVQPKLIEISSLFVQSCHPDHYWGCVCNQAKALFALLRVLTRLDIGPLWAQAVLLQVLAAIGFFWDAQLRLPWT
jgi:hypothetical protein